MPANAIIARLPSALHALDDVPTGTPWNLPELSDLLPGNLVPAAVLIGIVMRDEPAVVFTRRTMRLSNHAGQISFPGGRVDPGDRDAVSTALREAHEEIGLGADAVQPLGFLDPYVTITGFRVIPVVARVVPPERYLPDPHEVEEVFEAPLMHLLDPSRMETRERVFRGRNRHYHVIPWQGREIWGATASMLLNLRERLVQAADGSARP